MLVSAIVIEVKVDKLLKSRGKSRYWLAKETGMTQIAIANLSKGKTQRIDFSTLNSICKALDCTTGDVLEYVPDKGNKARK
jgi:putative transcriptional regulator